MRRRGVEELSAIRISALKKLTPPTTMFLIERNSQWSRIRIRTRTQRPYSCLCFKSLLVTILVIVIFFQTQLISSSPAIEINRNNDHQVVPGLEDNKKKLIEISSVDVNEIGPKYVRLNVRQSSDDNQIKSDSGGGDSSGHQRITGRYQVASIEFERVKIPLIIGLWIFFASLAKIGFHMAPKLHTMFPESCLLIVVGIVIGVVLFYATESVNVSPLTPDTFFLYMLPPIILDAGYFMPNRLFFDHIGTILLFAVVGTIFNTLTIGASLWAIGKVGLFQCETPLLDMLLFAALISAVDPVAVLAVFEEINVNEVLYILVFGESLLNDAVTVVLYNMFEVYTELGPENLQYIDVIKGVLSFFVVALGGSFIGVVWGFGTGFVTKYTHEVRVIEPIFIFVMAYLAYLNAELFHMSGILASTFCGITMKNYVEANVSHKSHTTVKYTMKMLSSSSETIIFMFLGVATINRNHNWNTLFVVLTIIFCSVYRTLGVIILSALANRFRLQKLTKVEKFVLSYGGLRGAVAFALVLLIDPKIVPLQPMFVTTTITVIYFTVFIQGITIKPLVKILNVKLSEKRKPTMNERIHERVMDHIMTGVEDVLGRHGNHHLRDKFKRFDNQFIRPLILRNHRQGHEPKILETYSRLTMKDAYEFMRRNASTVGNISGTESMSAIFRTFASANSNGSPSFSHIDSSTWNIDMQELDYSMSKKDMTDAKIHHLLDEELCLPYKKYRRLSYSRHAVHDKDLNTMLNHKKHMNMRKMLSENKKRHRKSGKKQNQEAKQTRVSFPEFSQSSDGNHVNEPEQPEDKPEAPTKNIIKDDWDGGIIFTAKSSICEDELSDANSDSLIQLQQDHLPPVNEDALPWHSQECSADPTDDDYNQLSKDYESTELIPNAVETIPPWKRDDTSIYGHTVQHEFPAWASNKDYLQYNSPSSRFTGGRDKMSGQQTTPPQPPLVSALRKQKSQLIEGGQGSSSVQEGRRASSLDNIINALQKLNLTPKSINSNLRDTILEENNEEKRTKRIRFLDSDDSEDNNDDEKKFLKEPD